MPYIISQLVLLFLVLFLNPAARAQQTLFPGAVPLAVRSPYLNCWEPLRNSSTFGRSWPMIYDISQVCLSQYVLLVESSHLRLAQTFGWTLLARIDGLTYSLFGGEVNAVNGTANLTSIAITPTRTLVVAQAGHMELNLTFLSPIEVRLALLLLATSTYASFKAWRVELGQAIHPILILVFHCKITRWFSSHCASVFGC